MGSVRIINFPISPIDKWVDTPWSAFLTLNLWTTIGMFSWSATQLAQAGGRRSETALIWGDWKQGGKRLYRLFISHRGEFR